jgi:bacterioferritin-associated ferredoxin
LTAHATGIRIDRCVCQRFPFSRLLPIAAEHGWSLHDIKQGTGCGDQCGLCEPYLRRMLATGETVFHEILEA